MTDTAGCNALDPTLLLFGELPKISQMLSPNLSLITRLTDQAVAWAEFETTIAKKRINTALFHKTSDAHGDLYIPGKPIYIYRKKEEVWTGPQLVRTADDKCAFIDPELRAEATQIYASSVRPAQIPFI